MTSLGNMDRPPVEDTVADTSPCEVVRLLGDGVTTMRELYGFRATDTLTTTTKLRVRIVWGGTIFRCPSAKEGLEIDKYVYDGEVYFLEAGARYSFIPQEEFVSIREERLDDSFVLPENPGQVEKIP